MSSHVEMAQTGTRHRWLPSSWWAAGQADVPVRIGAQARAAMGRTAEAGSFPGWRAATYTDWGSRDSHWCWSTPGMENSAGCQ